LSCIFSWIFW